MKAEQFLIERCDWFDKSPSGEKLYFESDVIRMMNDYRNEYLQIGDNNDNKMEEIYIKIVYDKPVPVSDFKSTSPMMNPISYELINPESRVDGLYLSPNLMDKNLNINMVYEVNGGKIVRVYKSKM